MRPQAGQKVQAISLTVSLISWHYPRFFVYWVKKHGQGARVFEVCGRIGRDARTRGSCRTARGLLPWPDAVGGSQERRADGGAGGAAASRREASVDASFCGQGRVERCRIAGGRATRSAAGARYDRGVDRG